MAKGKQHHKGTSPMRKLRNSQGIIIFVALGLVLGMSVLFVGRAPLTPSGGTSYTDTASPGSVTDLVNRGNAAYDSENFADAIKYYEQALEQNPNMVGVLADLGTSYWYLEPPQPTKAVELYNRAIALEPTFINAHYNKGLVLFYGLNKPQEAIEEWEKVLELDPPQNYIDTIKNKLIPAAKEKLASVGE
ncbi:MAG: tetratricopeptide repeat protein [Firmicutes bacterium]|nr:tetratricopeptide repeat protein [Bacillota bacterium]